jgi:ATP-binding cassette subfamily F protein uup
MGTVRLQVEQAEQSGKLVFEAKGISKGFGGAPIIRDFSTRVIRGDRIGLIGSNGAGKTTLLRMLLGELKPDEGEVRLGANVQIAYYDQQREQLDPDRTVFDTVGEGNDTVTSNGRTRHVHAYLRDFLFSDERARSPVKALSGGERNRLLLARLFTRPANVLVLDEPTNDLDLETLELLEEQLVEWPGTLLLVSHDRAFLDNVVTSTFVLEGDGRVREYVGGYEDWVRQRLAENTSKPVAGPVKALDEKPKTTKIVARRMKLSFKDQRELDGLPAAIDALEQEQKAVAERIAGSDFYKESAENIRRTLARAEELQRELATAYTRWGDLDARK